MIEEKVEREEVPKREKNPGYSVILLGVVSAILTMPLFMLLYKYFPTLSINLGDRILRLDHIILFLAIFFLTYYLVKKLRMVVYIALIAGLVALTITNFSGIYTLDNLYHDYSEFLYDLSQHSLRQKFSSQEADFKKEDELRAAIDYNNPDLRNYSASIAIKHFDDRAYLSKNRKWVQFFSVFKEVYSQWKYVYDPINEDYYSKSSETLSQLEYDEYFKGDCDDYSIMMASCIKAIGGEVRLVRTIVNQNGKEIGHMYPEVKFGDTKDLETVVYLIKNIYFPEESKEKSIFYFQDSKGFIWLNFDYNDAYPGGKYQSEVRESEIII
ncbi:MAG: transglutaminase family protein [Flavobacteriales bacterium]|nr:transglutaminase family protein [Flavobacteriales bacterium]